MEEKIKGAIKAPNDSVKNQLQDSEKSNVIQLNDNVSLNEIGAIKKDGNTIFHITEKYLNKHYAFRYNEISLDIEIKHKKSNKWESFNENTLWIELKKERRPDAKRIRSSIPQLNQGGP